MIKNKMFSKIYNNIQSVYFTSTGEEMKHATGVIVPISISNVEV
jgi:hypothetical protein